MTDIRTFHGNGLMATFNPAKAPQATKSIAHAENVGLVAGQRYPVDRICVGQFEEPLPEGVDNTFLVVYLADFPHEPLSVDIFDGIPADPRGHLPRADHDYRHGGLKLKYLLQKADGRPVDPDALYWVMRLDEDPHARKAALAYAHSVEAENPVLATELRELVAEGERRQFRQPVDGGT